VLHRARDALLALAHGRRTKGGGVKRKGVTHVISRCGVHHQQLRVVDDGGGPAAAFGGFVGVVTGGDVAVCAFSAVFHI
jgi:hypothetical protein